MPRADGTQQRLRHDQDASGVAAHVRAPRSTDAAGGCSSYLSGRITHPLDSAFIIVPIDI
jgi:hypothetical protein